MARRRRSSPEPRGPSAAEVEVRQLELARNQNDQKLKTRFERIFRKYEHDFTGVGDEIDIESGEIVVDNGHLQNMRDEADPGQSRSASSRFVKTFQEKLGHEGEEDEEGDEEEDDDDDDGGGDGEDDDESDDGLDEDDGQSDDGEDLESQADGTDEADDDGGVDTFERLPVVEPFRALKRPPPRLAQLLVGGTTPVDDLDASIEDSASGTSTPTGLLAQVPALQASMSTLAAKAKRPTVDTDTIQALGLTIANQLAQLMAGPTKKRKRDSRPVSRSNTTDPAWDYPEIAQDHNSRRKQRRMKSPIQSARISSPQAPSPDQRSLWAPTGRQKKITWTEPKAITPARRVLRSSRVTSSVLKKEDLRRCGNCSLTNSAVWQPGPDGEDLCTSCGKYYDFHGRMKSFDSPTPSVDDRESTVESSSDIRFESALSTPALTDRESEIAVDESLNDVGGQDEALAKPTAEQIPSEQSRQRILQPSRKGEEPEPQRATTAVQELPPVRDRPRRMQADAAPSQPAFSAYTPPETASETSLETHPTHADLALNEHAAVTRPGLASADVRISSLQQSQRDIWRPMTPAMHEGISTKSTSRARPLQSAMTESPLVTQRSNEMSRSLPSLRPSTQTSAAPSSSMQQSYRPEPPTDPSRWSSNSFTTLAPVHQAVRYQATVPLPTRNQFGPNTGEVSSQPTVVPDQSAPKAPTVPPKKEYDIFVNETPATLYTANTSRTISDADSPSGGQVVFTAEEDATLIRLREIDKLQWGRMEIPNRSVFALQNRYRRVLQGKPGPGRKLLEAQLATEKQSSCTSATPQDPEWNHEDDELLLELREDSELDWDEIAEIMDNHTEARIESRYEEIVEAERTKSSTVTTEVGTGHRFFAPEEDALIVRLREVDHVPWNDVSQYFNGRLLHSIQKRYSRVLAPGKRKLPPVPPYETTLEERMFEVDPELAILLEAQTDGPKAFDSREDHLIMQLRNQNLSWQAIAPSFPGRSADALQLRHAELLAGKHRRQQVGIGTAPLVRRTDAAPQNVYNAIGGNATTPFGSMSPRVHAQSTNDRPSFTMRPQHTNNAHAARGPVVANSGDMFNPEFAISELLPNAGHSSNRGPGLRHPFTTSEDDTIVQLRGLQGYRWEDIAAQLPGRSVKSISTRYTDFLRPSNAIASVAENSHQTHARVLPFASTVTGEHTKEDDAIIVRSRDQDTSCSKAAQHFPERGAKVRQNRNTANIRPGTRQSLPSASTGESRAQSGLLRHALKNSRRLSDYVGDQFRDNTSRGHNVDDPITLDDDDTSTVAISQQLNEELRHSVARPHSFTATKETSNNNENTLVDTSADTEVSSLARSVNSRSSPQATASSTALQQFLSRPAQQPKLAAVPRAGLATATSAGTARPRHSSSHPSPGGVGPWVGTGKHGAIHDTPVTRTNAATPLAMVQPRPAAVSDSPNQRQSMPSPQSHVAEDELRNAAKQSKGKAAVRQKDAAEQSIQSKASIAKSAAAGARIGDTRGDTNRTDFPSNSVDGPRGSASEESLVMPEKPKYSMLQLVHMAFEASQSETMFPREVAAWVQTNFEYYRAVPDKWKCGIRAELNFKDHFEAVTTDRGREFRLRPGLSPEVISKRQSSRGHAQRVEVERRLLNDRHSAAVKQAQSGTQMVRQPDVATSPQTSERDLISRRRSASPSSVVTKASPVVPLHTRADDDAPFVPADDDLDNITVVQPKRGRPRGSKTTRKYSADDDDDEYTPHPAKVTSSSNVTRRGRPRSSAQSTQASGKAQALNERPSTSLEIADSDDENEQELSPKIPVARSSEKRVHFMETVEVRRPVVSHEKPASSQDTTRGMVHQEKTSAQYQIAPPMLPALPKSAAFIKPSTPASMLRKPKSRVSDGALANHPSLRISQLRQYETPRRASTGMPIFTPQRAGTPTAIFAYRASPAASGAGDRFGYGKRVVETPVRELADPNEDELA